MDTQQLDKVDEDAFELDIQFVESGPDLGKILYDSSGGCGATCQSSCASCS
ncbi:FxLD family lanthipeptide [Glycomyces luteolus]|uniref:FxLD family lanthipeptide n=1 Tax=Glycomyces luteolus TaxID=2670330 RepID=A0A9X3PA38_9ACTN|nr:FxLD family lanthipeptide [Glycomyces luteolus]MDA1359738.1 FxLD family lanthipeptide [Glycomyces luteolus]